MTAHKCILDIASNTCWLCGEQYYDFTAEDLA